MKDRMERGRKMRYINTLREGETIRNIYLCKGKRSAETRNGKPYDNLILQDKTGVLDGKVWDPNSGGIADYEEMDFIEVYGEVINYNNNLQLNIKQIRKAQVSCTLIQLLHWRTSFDIVVEEDCLEGFSRGIVVNLAPQILLYGICCHF